MDVNITMKTHKELRQIKYNTTKKQIFEQMINLENHLIFKESSTGERVTLEELNALNEIYKLATQFGYVRNFNDTKN